jgi:hypothetical protein
LRFLDIAQVVLRLRPEPGGMQANPITIGMSMIVFLRITSWRSVNGGRIGSPWSDLHSRQQATAQPKSAVISLGSHPGQGIWKAVAHCPDGGHCAKLRRTGIQGGTKNP